MRTRRLSPFWLLFILTGLNLFNHLDRYVVNQVVESIRLDFGLTDGQAGRINTAFMIGYFVTAPFFGDLGDRFSRKWLIAFGIFVWSLGTVMTGCATGIALLRASAMAMSIFVNHLSGDFRSPEIVGHLSDAIGSRQKAVLILPVVLFAGGALWMALGMKTLRASRVGPVAGGGGAA